MAQGLYLAQKMTLAQTLAPQLQQSLVLLQAPTMELKALVEQEMQMNPVLEELPGLELDRDSRDGQDHEEALREHDPSEPPAELGYDPATEKESREPVDDFQAEFEKLAQLDQEWREHFSQTNIPLRARQEEEEKRQYMFDSLVAGTSLQENLLEQVRLSELTEEEQRVAEMVIGNIDDNGYLHASVDELAFSTNIPADQVRKVLQVVQSFHPPGVGARDLRECLMLQLEREERTHSLEYRIIRDQMDALGRRRLPEIARAFDLGVGEVQEAVERIAHLEPRPGRDFHKELPQFVVPEVFVEKVGDDYVVSGDNDHVPRLRISNAYKDLMAQPNSSNEVRDYIREKIRAGKFLIKSIHQRQQTILNIAREIVARQRDFLDHGVARLRPLTMMQVAEAVGVHETTVSRAVSGKYMQTPQGMFEMKYFFTSGIRTAGGMDLSNTSIKDKLSEMIRKEDSHKPLSDDALVQMLSQQGIQIARRTVAKYRAELNILPSNLRRVYKH